VFQKAAAALNLEASRLLKSLVSFLEAQRST